MYLAFRRILDVAVSLVLILLFSPGFAAAALLVRLDSPGPLLFRQARGGRFCRPFTSYKLRTMRADHVHDPREVVPLSHSAITPLGRFMRRFKIDELPQLWNVLIGDMSIIGPRPTIMDQVLAYDEFQRRRQDVRPGITGLAQVNASAIMPWVERIKYDVYYVDHLNPWMDLLILLKTPLVIVLGEERFAKPFEASVYGRRPTPRPAEKAHSA